VLIEIAYETVSDWAAKPRLYRICRFGISSEVVKLIVEIERPGSFPSGASQVFPHHPRGLNGREAGPIAHAESERDLIYEKFRNLVESMYCDEEEKKIVSQIVDLLN
jgi:hypothetical protein